MYVVQGIDIGRSELVLHVRVCEGLMRQLDGTVEKRFAKKEILYPLQVWPCSILLSRQTLCLKRCSQCETT